MAGVDSYACGSLLYGIWDFRGELAVVFTKAINICMECVGIG